MLAYMQLIDLGFIMLGCIVIIWTPQPPSTRAGKRISSDTGGTPC